MSARIIKAVQHGKTLVRWHVESASVNELTDYARERAEMAMATLRGLGIAESGYYDLLLVDQHGKELDGDILIA